MPAFALMHIFSFFALRNKPRRVSESDAGFLSMSNAPPPTELTLLELKCLCFSLFFICVCVCVDRIRLCGLRQPRGGPEGCGLAQSQRSPGADGEGKRRSGLSALYILLLVSPRCFLAASPPLFSSVALATSLQGGWLQACRGAETTGSKLRVGER